MHYSISRSYLFVPATRIERVPKALASGADSVIVDLEDAVAHSQKQSAREALARGFPNAQSVFVRVNGPDTEWFEEDLKVCAELGVLGVAVPKAETHEQMRHIASRLRPGAILFPFVETAKGYGNIQELCSAPGVQRLVFGCIDFQLDLGSVGQGTDLCLAPVPISLNLEARKRAGEWRPKAIICAIFVLIPAFLPLYR